MPNMTMTKLPMPEQDPKVRARNFEEVSYGYTEEMAVEEAQRCLNCKHMPCVSGCPVNVQIPKFISLIAQGKFADACAAIKETSALPAVCGRVCPQESQCEAKCVRGIKGEPVAIGRLERFAADWDMKNGKHEIEKPVSNGHKVAIIGAGPAGLTCAGDLAKKGYEVTIFEAFHKAGGVLVYGIPEFRLPKAIVQKEVEGLEKLGVKVMTDMVIGKVLSIDELMNDMGFEAVFVGSGAGLPMFMGIEGEDLVGVYSANEFLTRMRLGAEHVYIIYRRSEAELPARREEVHHAKEEGIEFMLLNNPVKINGDENGSVKSIECIKMELGEPDASGRRRPIPIEGSNFEIPVDTVIMSLGTSPNPLIRTTTEGLEANKHGCLIADDKMATTREGVYAGGDAVTGAATVILAMGAGKTAAASIDEYIQNKNK